MSLSVDVNNYRIDATRADDHKIRFTVKNSSGVAYNVTANTFKFTVKASLDDAIADAKFQKLSPAANGIDLTLAATGLVDVNLVPADTAALAGVYFYDLEMTEGGKVYTLREGLLYIIKDVTTAGSAPSVQIVGVSYIAITDALYLRDPSLGIYHKIIIGDDGFGNRVITDVGTGTSFPF